MSDPRIEKFADVLVNYSVRAKKGDLFLISSTELARPLIIEVFRAAVKKGAHPFTRIGIDGLQELFLKEAKPFQLEYVSPISKQEIKQIDCLVGINAPHNTRNLSNADTKRIAMQRGARKNIQKSFMERAAKGELKWVGTQFPTHSAAQDAGMSLADYEDFVYGACLLDKKDPVAEWKKISKSQAKIVRFLNRKKEIRIVAKDTDITFNVKGRKWINCDGDNNFPDGEVFTGPVENSANGHIRYTFPAVYGGREVEDIYLEFKDGKVVKAKCTKGEKYLHSMIDIDKGSRFVGELAIGTNYGIKNFTKNILFDEKIGGTCHIALGAAYPETGSKNVSALHWDMICDLRKGGQVFADGKVFHKNGKFLI
ncbi:MAG: aminopeptidase [candidate division Zixibacteria bacterium]|nr:aminopeptidase [candidate division Zixibacteria bacterium]